MSEIKGSLLTMLITVVAFGAIAFGIYSVVNTTSTSISNAADSEVVVITSEP